MAEGNRTFVIRDEWDNGEFMTGATVDLFVDGELVESKAFVASSEDPPDAGFSAYGNGRSNHAGTQARSYGWAFVDAGDAEAALEPFGLEWQREQQERDPW